jgi:hypothetical protein
MKRARGTSNLARFSCFFAFLGIEYKQQGRGDGISASKLLDHILSGVL